jgi:hypothetical protein
MGALRAVEEEEEGVEGSYRNQGRKKEKGIGSC